MAIATMAPAMTPRTASIILRHNISSLNCFAFIKLSPLLCESDFVKYIPLYGFKFVMSACQDNLSSKTF